MMSNSATNPPDPVLIAYEKGRFVGLATGALALSIVAFINLLGIEKSLLAGVLAILALQGARSLPLSRFRAWLALVLASIHGLTFIVVLVLYGDKLMQLFGKFIELYHSLS